MTNTNTNTNKDKNYEDLLHDPVLTISEAKNIACEALGIGEKYFYTYIRPKLNPRPQLIDEKRGRVASLKILKSELDAVIYEIKSSFKNRLKKTSSATNK